MPTNRTRRRRHFLPTISDAVLRYLTTGNRESGDVETFLLEGDSDRLRAAWGLARDAILADWIKSYPCSRLWGWWTFDAPKEAVHGWDHERFNSAQRRRLGGTGTPSHEVTCSWGGFDKGIPQGWVDEWQVEYYNGRAKDIHGNVIPTKYKEGDFKGVAIDPEDPPRYQSEGDFLDTHGLLSAVEKQYLEKHPELMEPELVTNDDE